MLDQDLVRNFLDQIGDDPDRKGLLDTPRRVSDMWAELMRGTDEAPPKLTCFPTDQDGLDCDQMVIVTDIDFASICEHHLLPFTGRAHVGYLPGSRVVGLSKVARVVRHYAARLQVQERLTSEVANYLYLPESGLGPRGVCVMLSATHLCMSLRGVRAPGHITTTHAIRGDIDKSEFLALVGAGR